MAAEKEVTLIIKARDRSRRVLRRLRRALVNLFKLGAGIGAGLVAGAVALFKSAQRLQTASELLGVSAEELQAAEIILSRFGISREETADVLRDIVVRATEARREAGDAREGFQRLGVESADALRAGPLELVQLLSDAVRQSIARTGDLQEAIQALDQIGGDALVALLPALRRGGFRAEIREIADSDTVRSNEAIAASAEASRITQERLEVQINRLATILDQNLPRLIDVLEATLQAYEESTSPEGAFPGGIGATAAGTYNAAVENVSRQFEAAARAGQATPVGAAINASQQLIALLQKIETNTREGLQ